MVKCVRFVAGLGVAHFPYDLTAERVQYVKRLAAVLPEDVYMCVPFYSSFFGPRKKRNPNFDLGVNLVGDFQVRLFRRRARPGKSRRRWIFEK